MLEHRTPYSLRHTYAAFSIAAGVSLFELARFMGTSVEQIDRTYGHLLPDSIDRTRSALDSFVAAQPQEAEGLGTERALLDAASSPARKRESPALAGPSSHRGAEIRTRDLQSPRLAR